MRLELCEQGSREWHRFRVGRITGTRFGTVAHGGPRARNTLLDTLEAELRDPEGAVERALEGFSGGNLEFGRTHEPALIARYELLTGRDVRRVGIAIDEEDPYLAASPDGLCGDLVIEGKSRVSQSRHAVTLTHRTIDREYRAQVFGQLMVTGYRAADFVSFCPSWADFADQIAIVRIPRDEIYIADLRRKCRAFWEVLLQGDRFPETFEIGDDVPNFFAVNGEDH